MGLGIRFGFLHEAGFHADGHTVGVNFMIGSSFLLHLSGRQAGDDSIDERSEITMILTPSALWRAIDA